MEPKVFLEILLGWLNCLYLGPALFLASCSSLDWRVAMRRAILFCTRGFLILLLFALLGGSGRKSTRSWSLSEESSVSLYLLEKETYNIRTHIIRFTVAKNINTRFFIT